MRGRGRLAGAIAALLAVAISAYLVASYVVADAFTYPQRHAVDGRPEVRSPYEDVEFTTSDGLTLRGWFFPAGGDRAAVLVHGRDTNRREWRGRSERIADFLIADGFAVLLFDLRGHGESQGTRYTMGFDERRDVAAAIEFLAQRGLRKERIGVVGISLGAASALALLTIDPRIGPVVLDSSFADVGVLLSEKLPTEAGVPGFLAPGVLLAARVAFGIDAGATRPLDIVRAHPERAFLFIHCDADELVAVHHAHELRAASANPASELWIARGCIHPRASDDYPDEYRERVLAFLRAQLR